MSGDRKVARPKDAGCLVQSLSLTVFKEKPPMAKTSAIPQPKPLPILGNLPDIAMDAPVQSFMRLAQTHGPIFRLLLGGRTVTVLSSQELVDEICDETRFEKKVHKTLENIRVFAGDGLFTAFNEEPNWGKAHRLLMPAFGPLGVRGMFDKMLDIADQMLLRWERFGDDVAIDVADNMTRLTLDTIALCAFDYRFNSFYQNEMHPFVAAMVGALDEAGARARRPEAASRMMLMTKRRYEADIALLHKVADTLIAERRRDPDAASRNDLLNIMLSGRDPVTGEGLSDENIRFQMVTFLIAGHETTSGLLSFALYLLMKNPEAMSRARAAVDDALGDAPPRLDDLARLRFIEQVLMEALRLWPTAPAFAVRPFETTVIGGRYAVTPEDTLMVLVPSLHRDPEVWGEDAEAFRPERFAPEIAAGLPANAWKPFGNGARACIGRGFAMQEAQLVLAMILQRFDLVEADPGYRLKVAETLTLKPHDFRLRARRRRAPTSRPRSAVPTAPQRALTATPAAAPKTAADAIPLLVLYGSNTGSCEAFAQRIAGDAAAQGFSATAAAMDAYVERLPTEGALVIVTASYEGKPPDNAQRFLAWLEGLPSTALAGRPYGVFGCGNRQWARTYQAIPKRTDAALEAAGATRVLARGETDAGGDFFGGFDKWYADLWPSLGAAFGRETTADAGGQGLDVEILRGARETALRLADLDQGRIIENRELVDLAKGLAPSKRHIEIALPPGMTYRTGDYLAVLPRNPPADVERALRRFGLAQDTQIVIRKGPGASTALPTDYPVTAAELLSSYVELGQPATRAQVAMLAEATRCPPDKAALTALAQTDRHMAEILQKRVSVLDLLGRFEACELSFAAFLAALPVMRARQYSISSSPLRDPRRCSLTIAVLDAPALGGGRRHRGVASTYLAGLEEGASLSVAVRPSQAAFHPPVSPATPLIMVCAGSGIAPFHGFLQERALQKAGGLAVGPALLFFGAVHQDADFLYEGELSAWEKAGVVAVRTAFSQSPDGDVRYVQHRLWQDRADVAALFRRGAIVFVCGVGAVAWAYTVVRDPGRYVADVFA
jgi:cytochrome P450/NADPH-cytochrome P450 reductase